MDGNAAKGCSRGVFLQGAALRDPFFRETTNGEEQEYETSSILNNDMFHQRKNVHNDQKLGF
jgi:hypothetical protein